MNSESELPDDVIEAIHNRRKLDAIRLLREHRDLGLREAKDRVDAYARRNRHLIAGFSPGSRPGLGRVVWVVVLMGIVYLLFRRFG